MRHLLFASLWLIGSASHALAQDLHKPTGDSVAPPARTEADGRTGSTNQSAHRFTARVLPLPHSTPNLVSGRSFLQKWEIASPQSREEAIIQLIGAGGIPEFLREFSSVGVTNVTGGRTNTGRLFVAPDYLAVGHNDDYLLMPMTPQTAQRIADSVGCLLPTRKMVDAIYAAAAVKLPPIPLPPGPAMTTLAVFAQHNDLIRTQRAAFLDSHPLGSLVAGHKKDVVISARLAGTTNKVAIYGWHRTNGLPIQPLYTGHRSDWVDYSHGIRLVSQVMEVNGQTQTVAAVLADPELAGLISDEGVVLNSRYLAGDAAEAGHARTEALWPEGFVAGHFPGETIRELHLPHGVRILINAPATDAFSESKPIRLILYALPNGNTIEQTVGRKLQPGDDWRFDIQHIGAQTRFLRRALPDHNLVVAYLENSLQSWPAWRREHGNNPIPLMLERVKAIFARWPVEVVLTGHSGGGSWTFGYLETVDDIPPVIQRIAFLDSNYAYETSKHADKLARWLGASGQSYLCILAYHDSVALLDGKAFVSATGGTWGRSHAMLEDLGARFDFTHRTNGILRTHAALDGRLQFLLFENPERKIVHTVQVERNGFIHAMLTGTPNERKGYEYFGERAYGEWISAE